MKNIYGKLDCLIFNNHPHIEGEYEAEINYLYKEVRKGAHSKY